MTEELKKIYHKKRISCPLCNCIGKSIFRQTFACFEGASLLNEYDICECTECSMIFANNIESQEFFDTYYQNQNKYESYIANTALPQHKQLLVDYLCMFDKSLKIADFGCGSGDLLRELHLNGFLNLYALDTSELNCNALSNLGINTLCKSVFELSDTDYHNSLDIIIVCAVLEHIVDLQGFINNILLSLNTDGILIINVPIIDVEMGNIKPFQEFSIEHINYFSYNTIIKLLNNYDFEPIAQFSGTGYISLAAKRCQINTIGTYIDNSLHSIEHALIKIEKLIEPQTPVLVWGVGTLTRYLLENTRFAKLNIKAFIDSNIHYQGITLAGKKIFLPTEASSVISDEPIIIVTYNNNTVIKEIIYDLNIKNETICLL